MELFCSGNREELVCLEFYPCFNLGSDISWWQWHIKEPLVVFKSDYRELLLGYFNRMFPLIDPANEEIQEYFDVCSYNWIGRDDWRKLIQRIKNDMNSLSDSCVINFYQKFISWCETQLTWAELIVVDGNQ